MEHLKKPICVRFSVAEWEALEARRRKRGFRSLSELVRTLCREPLLEERVIRLEEQMARIEKGPGT